MPFEYWAQALTMKKIITAPAPAAAELQPTPPRKRVGVCGRTDR